MEKISFPFSKDEYWAKFREHRAAHLPTAGNREFCERMTTLADKYFREIVDIAQATYAEKMLTSVINMECSWHPSRKNSWGGIRKKRAFISIGMVRATMPFPVKEYDLINLDREIGFLNTWSSEVTLAMTIAHEVAHAVHALIVVKARKEGRRIDRKPHGEYWRRIYRLLRVEYVNKMAGG